ncbi:MAG TPA: phospholipase D-like domain-containing protein [Burkholderiaceae bacterium]|jgi:phospholipase D1/2
MSADQYTAQLTKDTLTYITGQYFDLVQPFAFPRYKNDCKAYTTGRDYFEAVAKAIREAKSFILITDWELDYDVELEKRGVDGHPGRLSELLADALQRGVHIRVMLYDSIRYALDTHDDTTQHKLLSLPKGKGSISVLLENPNTGRSTVSRESGVLFSHHQKSVVVDGQIAFLGGLDLAYGRWDTNAFDVVIDPKQRIINDAYNQQLSPARGLTEDEKKLTKEINGKPGFQTSYDKDGRIFDERFQPRQPWQDVGLHVKGPAAFDVFVNFVLRWNSFAGKDSNILDEGLTIDWFKKAKGADYLVDPLKDGEGTVNAQICRSVSSKQLQDELKLWDDRHQYVNDDWKQSNPKRRKIVQTARKEWTSNHQTSILDAMINCIRSAHGFIYIENQFFMSDCGADQFGTSAPSNNPIIAELATAIGQAIYRDQPFHVWLVLPEHPEGKLEEDSTKSQAWWALQGTKRARNSLINRINATLVAKNRKAWSLQSQLSTKQEIDALLQKHGMQDKWREYLTILNLRNYGNTGTHMVTEMIYVHSKLMIVDDAVAIIGSANINDRSLNGNGDTELAAVIVDTAEAKVTEVGQGLKINTRKFARDLRMNQMKKHLGMLVDQKTTGVQKENAPPNGINIEQPLSAATIKGIQQLAQQNREAYNEVFLHTPRNNFKTLTEGREHAYPLIPGRGNERNYASAPPLQATYMKSESIDLSNTGNSTSPIVKQPSTDSMYSNSITYMAHDVAKATSTLRSKVKGFWVEMPLDWGNGHRTTPPPPKGLPAAIASNDKSDSSEVVAT